MNGRFQVWYLNNLDFSPFHRLHDFILMTSCDTSLTKKTFIKYMTGKHKYAFDRTGSIVDLISGNWIYIKDVSSIEEFWQEYKDEFKGKKI